jgi:hypothetical protein
VLRYDRRPSGAGEDVPLAAQASDAAAAIRLLRGAAGDVPTDQWVQVDASISAWQQAARASGNEQVTITRLPGCDHTPASGQEMAVSEVSPHYTAAMISWLGARLS